MAINISHITGESAQKAFIDRVISRSDQIYPNTDHNVIRSVTANYEADELIPRSLTVDIEACDQSLSKRMTIYNVETTYDINYHTGETRR